jgi:hypothetical protein
MSDEKYFGRSRKWLNPERSSDTGMVSWEVSVWNGDRYIDGTFHVWDCSRKISLDFNCSVDKPDKCKQRADKFDILIKELQDMREAMGKALDYANQNTEDQDE